MDILDSALAREIEAISANPNTDVAYYWRAEIHANGQTLQPPKVLSFDVGRDYESTFTDESVVTMVVPGGMYAFKIYPYLKDLEITMYREPLGEVDGLPAEEREISSERYVATLINPMALNVAGNSANEIDETSLDLTNLLTLKFQLINKAIDQVRMRTIGGVYRKCLVDDVVRSILTMHSSNVETDSSDVPLGVEMVPSSNVKQQEHIVIPHGTRLVDAVDYIHKHCCGIYTTGLAYYYQANHWYVFPPYDSSKFDQSDNTMTIIRLPANRMPGVERTFRKDGKNLVILATGDAATKNQSESLLMNSGNGVRFADADQFMDGIVQKGGNRAVMSRGGSNNEFVATERPNGNNLVLSSQKRITSNPWVEYSNLAKRNGSLLGLTWENSNPAFITPGMPVKVLYLEDEEIKETFGLIIKAHHYTQTRGEGITVARHHTTSALTIFAQRELPQ